MIRRKSARSAGDRFQAPSLRLWVAEARRWCSPTATAREGGRVPRVVSPTVGVLEAGRTKLARETCSGGSGASLACRVEVTKSAEA